MISKILVPIDGSKVSQKAAKYAVELAKQTGASLTLLSVIDNRFVVGTVGFSFRIADPFKRVCRRLSEAVSAILHGRDSKGMRTESHSIQSGNKDRASCGRNCERGNKIKG